MNKTSKWIFDDLEKRERISDVVKIQFQRRKGSYVSMSYDLEDIEQEVWLYLFENNIDYSDLDIEDVCEDVERELERIAAKARRKKAVFEEVPISQFEDCERAYFENLFYGINTMEDEYV